MAILDDWCASHRGSGQYLLRALSNLIKEHSSHGHGLQIIPIIPRNNPTMTRVLRERLVLWLDHDQDICQQHLIE